MYMVQTFATKIFFTFSNSTHKYTSFPRKRFHFVVTGQVSCYSFANDKKNPVEHARFLGFKFSLMLCSGLCSRRGKKTSLETGLTSLLSQLSLITINSFFAGSVFNIKSRLILQKRVYSHCNKASNWE